MTHLTSASSAQPNGVADAISRILPYLFDANEGGAGTEGRVRDPIDLTAPPANLYGSGHT